MAGARIELELDDRPVQEALERLLEAGEDLSPALQDIGEYLQLSHDDRFRDQVDPDGTPWAPLSPRYRRRKRRNADKILVLDGFLRDLLRYQEDGQTLEFGTDRPYGATHQFGDPDRNIPARPFLGISDDDEIEILAILRDHLAEAVDG